MNTSLHLWQKVSDRGLKAQIGIVAVNVNSNINYVRSVSLCATVPIVTANIWSIH